MLRPDIGKYLPAFRTDTKKNRMLQASPNY